MYPPLTYSQAMLFIETPIFTEDVESLLSPDSYRALQQALVFRPDAGSVIPGTRGLRKLRWRSDSGGKRGGLRVIYFWIKDEETIYLLTVYPKTRQDDLTPQQLKILSRLVREEFP